MMRSIRMVLYLFTLSMAALFIFKDQAYVLFPVHTLVLKGTFAHVDQQQLADLVEKKTRAGFFAMDIQGLREDALALPWVRKVWVRRSWPDSLMVQIEEHQPVAVWQAGGYINHYGEHFNVERQANLAELPILSGPAQSNAEIAKRHQRFQGFLTQSAQQIKRIDVDQRHAWSVTFADGMVLKLGRLQLEQRFLTFISYLPRIEAMDRGRIKHIDLRYTNGFAVQWNDVVDKRNYTG